VLEPSAGQGAIVKAIHRATGEGLTVHCFEAMPVNITILNKLSPIKFWGEDFLNLDASLEIGKFDRIIANPPFAKNQDIDHIRAMYDILEEEGTLVSIAGKHWQLSANKKETSFREWLDEVGADVIELSRGMFKESGTEIATCIIVIKK
jgi:methylase of polypeptide subunit release factors